MFKDTEKELKRLEAELLAEEEMDLQQEEEADEEISDTWADDTQVFECVPQHRDSVIGYESADGLYDTDEIYHSDDLYDTNRIYPTDNIYNSDNLDEDLDSFSEEVREPKKDSLTGLLITALLLTAGILIVVAWWLIRYWEAFR